MKSYVRLGGAIFAALTLFSAVSLLLSTAFGQSTAFTYQGRLNDGASPANGNYDLRFVIYDSPGGGVPQGNAITNNATAVSDGLFSVTLDFGDQFPGAERWLEIGVRTNGGGAFSTLTPRQLLSASPYAVRAANAATAASASSVTAANITGTIPLEQLPTSIVTNGASGVNISGRFNGNAGGMTNLLLSSLADHEVVAWGNNSSGQTTVPDAARRNVTAIAAGGAHMVALKSDGGVLAWGWNGDGQTNVPIAAQSDVTAIAAGGLLTVALKDGSVLAWGWAGVTNVPVAAQSDVAAIAAGYDHIVALKTDGSVVAWGGSQFSKTTVPVDAQSGVAAIAAGQDHTVVLKTNGTVLAWGNNCCGQTNVPVAAQSGVVAIAAGTLHTVALKTNGSVLAWGHNFNGQTNVPVAAQSGVAAIAAGFHHTAALKTDGSVLAWGNNSFGQTNVPAAAQSGVVAIASADSHLVALVSKVTFHPEGGLSFGLPVSATTFSGSGSNLTSLNAANISSGTLADARLSTNISRLGQTIESTEITDGTLVNADIHDAAGIVDTKLAPISSAGKVADSALSSNVALRSSGNTFSGNQVVTNGNVGIGTLNPGANRLQINTNFHLASGWALQANDAVFGANIQINRTNGLGIALLVDNSSVGDANTSLLLVRNNVAVAAQNLFLVRSDGNVGIGITPTNKLHVAGGVSATAFVTTSDRHAKENFAPVSPQEVLNKVAALPITTWNFKQWQDGRHMGPMAQDFYDAFGLGGGDTTITSMDPDGVALAAIQGLNQKLEQKESEITELKQRVEKLESLLHQKLNGSVK